MLPVVESISDEIIRKMLILAKFFIYILKAYVMYVFTKFRDSSFSQSEVT